MNQMSTRQLVEDYYQKSLMAFLPNICNSACEFCSVIPLVGQTAKLSRKVLSNFEQLVQQAKSLGFESVRLTGGEPLLFRNFSEIVECLANQEMDYTLLSNGQKIADHIEALLAYPPQKISVSFHSLTNYEEIFKHDIDIDVLFKHLRSLQNTGCEVSMTVVFLPENQQEINDLITFFETKPVDMLKIIFPNYAKVNDELLEQFHNLNLKPSALDIRMSNLEEKSCLLSERGFMSVIIEGLDIYNCCITLGETEHLIQAKDSFNLEELLHQQYHKNQSYGAEQFPCKSYIGACPIALKKVENTSLVNS